MRRPVLRSGRWSRVQVASLVTCLLASVVIATFPEPAATAAGDAAPVVTVQPLPVVTTAGGRIRVWTAATGTPTPTVAWTLLTCTLFCTPSTITGATSPTLTMTAPTGTATYQVYARYTNSSGSALTNTVDVSIRTAPTVATQPTNQIFGPGGSATFSTVVAGVPTPSLQWQRSVDAGATWSNVPGAGLSSLTVGALVPADAGTRYRVVATNTQGSATSSAASLVAATPPSVSAQPVGATAKPTVSASFTVNGSGSPAPTVQWERSLDGGTTWSNFGSSQSTLPNTLSVSGTTNASINNGALLRARLTNIGGTVTSDPALLSVEYAPSVTSGSPTSVTVVAGDTVNLATTAIGNPTPTVKWQRSVNFGTFTDIAGATSPAYSFTATASDNNTRYQALYTNAYGSASSQIVTLTVQYPPTVTVAPVDRSAPSGTSTSFTATVGGANPSAFLKWQVSSDGGGTWSDISNNSTSLFVGPVTPAMDGNRYRIVASNSAGSAISSPGVLTVTAPLVPPPVQTHPQSQSAAVGASVTFSASATGNPTTTQWQRSIDGGTSWSNVSATSTTVSGGVTTTRLTLTAAMSLSGGLYRVLFTSTQGTSVTNTAGLTVTGVPVVVTAPATRTGIVGGTATFSASMYAESTPSVEWQRSTDAGQSWAPVATSTATLSSGVFSSQRSVSPLSVTDDGALYRAVFTTASGSTTTASALLSVGRITSDPSDATVAVGSTATFVSAAAAATAPTVQWQLSTNNGSSFTNVSGATSPTFSVAASAVNNGALLRAVYTLGSSTFSTQPCRLIVAGIAPTVAAPPAVTTTVGETDTAIFTAVIASGDAPSIQWERSSDNGTTWSNVPTTPVTTSSAGVTTTTLSFASSRTDSGLRYRVKATNQSGATTSGNSQLSVYHIATAPADVNTTPGQTATFSVTGLPSSSIAYDWTRSDDGGETWATQAGSGSSISFLATPALNGTMYRARARTVGGGTVSPWSSAARLTVNSTAAPVMKTQPTSPGTLTFTLSAAATSGVQPDAYFEFSRDAGVTWSRIEADASTWSNFASSVQLTVTTTAMTAGSYRAVFETTYGRTTSTIVGIGWSYAPVVTREPSDLVLTDGAPITFDVTVEGNPTPSPLGESFSADGGVTWQAQDCSGVAGAICGVTATVAYPHLLHRRSYYNSMGTVTTRAARIDVVDAPKVGPAVYGMPSETAVSNWMGTAGTSLTLYRQMYSTTTAPSVQWQTSSDGVSWIDVAGGAVSPVSPSSSQYRAQLAVTPTASDQGARYRAVFTNDIGSTPSAPIAIDVGAPVILQQPLGVTTTPGTAATFTAGGIGATSIAWQRSSDEGANWSTISGATSSTFTITPLVTDHRALFRARLTNASGTATTNVARLTLTSIPQSISFSSSLPSTLLVGDGFTIAATASSGLPVEIALSGACASVDGSPRAIAAGTCSVTASQAGDSTFAPAPLVSQVASVARRSQTISFDDLPSGLRIGSQFVVAPSASSLLPLQLSASGACSIVGSQVTVVAIGICTVTASQVGNEEYEPAAVVERSAAVSVSEQVITFDPLPTDLTIGSEFTVAPSASSGLAVTISASGACTVDGSRVTARTAGMCTLVASQAGDADFAPAPDVTQEATIARVPQTLTLSAPESVAAGASFTVVASASSGLPVSISVSGQCTLTGSSVKATSIGVCRISARQAGDETFAAAPVAERVVSVVKAQTITFGALPTGLGLGSTFSPTASATSGLPVEFVAAGSCSIDGGTVTVTGYGQCTITAQQFGNGSWAAAPPVSRSTVAKAPQSITFGALPSDPGVGTAIQLAATTTASLPVTYSASGGCTVLNSTLRFVTAGVACSVTAKQPGNATFDPAPPVTRSTTPVRGVQRITPGWVPQNLAIGDSFVVTATSSSQLPVSIAASGPCVAIGAASGSTVIIAGAGTCTIEYQQAGDENWMPAAPTSRSTIVRAVQSISFPALPDGPAVGTTIALRATTSSGLGVTYKAVGGCTVVNSSLRLVSAIEPCDVTASQAGNAYFLPAAPLTRSTSAIRGPQTIQMASPPSGLVIGSTFVATASATSGLPVSLAASGACSMAGSTSGSRVTIESYGTCFVSAEQPGDASWLAAPLAIRSTIVRSPQEITFPELQSSPAVGSAVTLRATASSGVGTTYAAAGGCTVVNSSLRFTSASVPCTVTATQPGNTYYLPANPVVRTTSAIPGPQTIAFGPLPQGLSVGASVVVYATSTSRLPVSLGVTGPCSIAGPSSGSAVTIEGSGTCTVTASQVGDADWLPAPVVSRSTIVRASQSITFPPLPASPSPGTIISLGATTSAGLGVTYQATGGCSLFNFTRLKFQAAGQECTVTATQPGNPYYLPAPAVTLTTTIGG